MENLVFSDLIGHFKGFNFKVFVSWKGDEPIKFDNKVYANLTFKDSHVINFDFDTKENILNVDVKE